MDTVKEYLKQWLSPGVILGVVGWIFLLGVASVRLSSLETQVAELKATIVDGAKDSRDATVELVRYQERINFLTSRVQQVEDFKTVQEQVNVRVFSGLAKLGG